MSPDINIVHQCYMCQKSLFHFQEEYVDEFNRPKYHLDDKIFCGPVCSNDYVDSLKKDNNNAN